MWIVQINLAKRRAPMLTPKLRYEENSDYVSMLDRNRHSNLGLIVRYRNYKFRYYRANLIRRVECFVARPSKMKLFSLTLLALLVITHLCDGFSVSRPYSSDSLTELIAEGNIFSARDAAKVTGLPNAPDIPSYAGYLTINETTDSNLFFWFFPSEVS